MLTVNINEKEKQSLNPIWRYFGYDEANYTYMKDGKKLLSELAALSPVPVFVRTHNLLTSGKGVPALKWSSTNAYTEDAQGNPVYNWKLVDSVFDTYIKRGMKPLAQVGFMPEALSVKPESDGFQTTPDNKKVYHYTGWNQPPKDYNKYANLVYAWVKHCISRYGLKEVQSWYWEIWNEPDLNFYWKGTTAEYIKLYDYAADAIKRALPTARIGGPETTNPGGATGTPFLKAFLNHVVNEKSAATGKPVPLDFITFHAKGNPKLIDSTVWMNMGAQLGSIDKGFEIISAYLQLKNLPIIIGESDPEGCAACPQDFFPQYAYRNATMYASYTAASFPRKYDLAQSRRVNLLGAVTWAFEFENQPWFRGFRDLATNGVDKPVLNVFRMFGRMRGNRVPVTSSSPYDYRFVADSSIRGAEPDVNGFATDDGHTTYLMVWNYHDKNDPAVDASPVTVIVQGLKAGTATVRRYLIDSHHSNSYTAWQQLHSPQQPTAAQYRQLQAAGQLVELPPIPPLKVNASTARLNFNLERQGVVLITITH
jgi:xylan 1,4-beta-xylosidase